MRGKSTTAADRAVQRWGECCLHVRGEMRDRGVRGALPQMDRYVSASRGGGYARFLHDFAAHVRQVSGGKIPPEVLARELGALSADVVMAVYTEPAA
jgi:hypothetical protein